MRIVLVLVIAATLGAGAYLGVTETDLIKLQEIRFEGVTPLSENRLKEKLKTKPGDPLWKIPVTEELKRLKTDPWVETAEMRREFPRALVIRVQEKQPVALTSDENGRFSFVDNKNTLIDKAETSDAAIFPVLAEMAHPKKIDLRAQALEILKQLPEQGILSKEDVSDIHYSEERGFNLTLTKKSGSKFDNAVIVDLGKENLNIHLDRARRVAQYLHENHINALRIDSDYAKKVLVKVRKGR